VFGSKFSGEVRREDDDMIGDDEIASSCRFIPNAEKQNIIADDMAFWNSFSIVGALVVSLRYQGPRSCHSLRLLKIGRLL
jgi:hypothetical protein